MVEGFVVGLSLIFIIKVHSYLLIGTPGLSYCINHYNLYLGTDIVGYALGFVTILIWVVLVTMHYNSCGIGFISVSVVSALLCFCSTNMLLFWVSYEVSILSLLLKLYLDSPYSDRFSACWYFAGYFVLTSLPLLLVISYLGCSLGSFTFCMPSYSFPDDVWWCEFILFVCFIMKLPVFPFHSWLPIVHAEAPNMISVCLSGYIMKLGVFGIYRFCSGLVPASLFSELYTYLVLLSCVFFFILSLTELDCKRWLAYLSLAHMGCSCYGLCVVNYGCYHLPVLNCLGHGISSALCFTVFGLMSSVSGTRNFLLLKSSISVLSVLGIFVLLSVLVCSSVPPSFSFFCEVLTLSNNLYSLYSLLWVFCVYMLLGGSLPLIVICSGYHWGYKVRPANGSIPHLNTIAGVVLYLYFSLCLPPLILTG